MDAATLIRTAREGAGLSQGALAARAGTSQPAVSRYESGASSPSVETLDRLLAAMGSRLELVAEVSPRRLDVRTPRMAKLRFNGTGSAEQRTGTGHRTSASSIRWPVSRIGPSLTSTCWSTSTCVPAVCSPSRPCRTSFFSVILGERVDVVPRDALAPHIAQTALAEAVPL